MSTLSAFLNPLPVDEEREVMISDRFRDEEGNPVPFRIRALTQAQNDAIAKQATRIVNRNGQKVKELDQSLYSTLLVVAGTVQPDFAQNDLCTAYGVLDPNLVPGRMLRAGEFARLMEEISALSGFEQPEALAEEAKN